MTVKPKTRRLATALALFVAVSAKAGEIVPIDAKAMPLTAHMQRAHEVENLSVKPQSDGDIMLAANLTFADGSKVYCRYLMSAKLVQIGGESGIQFVPKSEKCSS